MSNDPIYVTKPFLPPIDEFKSYIDGIWDRHALTNGGPLHKELEDKLCDYLDVPYISLFNNCTIGLMSAFPVLGIKSGEVITSPFTFVATAHAIKWCGLTPVFVDIDPETLNIDPTKIEAAITPDTKAVMAVHCYGRPCDVDAIQALADKHGLKVIYDAAHIFGAEDNGGSLARHGDLAVLSFHATKVFNTFEGGAIICHDKDTKDTIDRFKNFGIVDDNRIDMIGLNGKMSEIHAAMGLAQLPHIDHAILERKRVYDLYHKLLVNVDGLRLPNFDGLARANYAYFPIIVGDDYPLSRDKLADKLRNHGIFTRKYFYPLITDLKDYPSGDFPVAKGMANNILCLPMYPDLGNDQIEAISNLLR